MQAPPTAYRSPCPEGANFIPISVDPNLTSKFKSRRLSSLLWPSSGIHWSGTLPFACGDGSFPGFLNERVVNLRDSPE
jgi:hypothetical protein